MPKPPMSWIIKTLREAHVSLGRFTQYAGRDLNDEERALARRLVNRITKILATPKVPA